MTPTRKLRIAAPALRRAAAVVVGSALAAFASAPERAIEAQVVVAAPIDAVWQAWTTRAGIESFFAPEAEVVARASAAPSTFISIRPPRPA